MLLKHIYKPVPFFLIAFFITWISWFLSAFFSYKDGMAAYQFAFLIFGLLGPATAAFIMMSSAKKKNLWKDFWSRLTLRTIRLKFWLVLFLLFPIALFAATALSLLFGQSTTQFNFSAAIMLMKGYGISSVLILFAAPIFEELGWRGYGVDSIRANFNILTTTLVFSLLWGLWHLPLFFINGYYHHELWNTSVLYVINFFVSVVPASILMNWIYFSNRRNIIAAILFHCIINLFSAIFQTGQCTKCILTVLLVVVAAICFMMNKSFFLTRKAEKDF